MPPAPHSSPPFGCPAYLGRWNFWSVADQACENHPPTGNRPRMSASMKAASADPPSSLRDRGHPSGPAASHPTATTRSAPLGERPTRRNFKYYDTLTGPYVVLRIFQKPRPAGL